MYSPMRLSNYFGLLGAPSPNRTHAHANPRRPFPPSLSLLPDAGLLAMCSTAYVGAALVIVPRFSTHRFWDDVLASKATILHVRGVRPSRSRGRPP